MAATTSTELAPGLLLAMPQLVDPNFSRAVVLMVEHNDSGSFGLVINQPSEMTAHSLLQELEMEWNGDGSAVVWRGGPVMPTSGWVLHTPGESIAEEDSPEGSATIPLVPGVVLSTSTDNLRAIAESPPDKVRLLLGYAGWGPGQLASEMARGSWLHADITPRLVFDTPADDIWEHALRSLGIDPEAVVPGMGIH